MDIFLTKVTQQAMNYAIRSGITITASYAIRQSSRLLKNVRGSEREELQRLQERLQSKIRIISPAIDMIELIAARGNTSLETAVSLTKDLRWEIQSLGQRLAKAATAEELLRKGAISSKAQAQMEIEVKLIIDHIKTLLNRIEDAVPLINLAITTSGANLSTSLPSAVSPSRLLQGSTFLTAGDTQYSMSPEQAVQVGPTFTLSMYMLFAGHVRPQDEEGVRETTWKEVIHKARVKVRRVPVAYVFPSLWDDGDFANSSHPPSHVPAEGRADEFAYQILIIEDLDDGRVHSTEDDEPKPGRFDDVETAGMREIIPIHQISKIFYADTGKILNIGTDGQTNSPVLLLKRDVNAFPPRRMMDRQETDFYDPGLDDAEETDRVDTEEHDDVQSQIDAQLFSETQFSPIESSSAHQDIPETWRLPPGLDPEWVAFEVYSESDDSDSETETETEPPASPRPSPRGQSDSSKLADNMEKLNLTAQPGNHVMDSTRSNPLFNNIRTSLSLLEMLLRLTSLQQFQQQSHLSITDELLNFFLEESSTTGAGGDENHRQRVRADARRKVGWDPYDESPLKRRGEDYLHHNGAMPDDGSPSSPGRSPGPWDDGAEPSYRGGTPDHGYYSSRYSTRSREQTPEPGSPSGAHSPTPSPSARPPARRRHMRSEAAVRRGSPLAKPPRSHVDEGLGTSPSSAPGGEDNDRKPKE